MLRYSQWSPVRVVQFNFIEFIYYCFEKENTSSSIIMICDEKYDICVLFCSSCVGREPISHVFLLFWKEKRPVFLISSSYIKKYKNVQEMHNIKSFCILKLNFDFDNLQLKCENLLYNVFIHFCWNSYAIIFFKWILFHGSVNAKTDWFFLFENAKSA